MKSGEGSPRYKSTNIRGGSTEIQVDRLITSENDPSVSLAETESYSFANTPSPQKGHIAFPNDVSLTVNEISLFNLLRKNYITTLQELLRMCLLND